MMVSTSTVVPTPLTDQATNNGTPFVIQLRELSTTGYTKRQQSTPYWLMANGNTTTNGSLATHFQLANGQLFTTDGAYFTTNYNVGSQTFAASDTVLPINSTFASNNGVLSWTNVDFTNGTAQFYQLPAGLLDGATILVEFLDHMKQQESGVPVVLMPEPRKSDTKDTLKPELMRISKHYRYRR